MKKIIFGVLILISFSAAGYECYWDDEPSMYVLSGSDGESCRPLYYCQGDVRCVGGLRTQCGHIRTNANCGSANECAQDTFVTFSVPQRQTGQRENSQGTRGLIQ